MSKPIKKVQILLDDNRLLGSLIFFKDKLERECLKLSFKDKLSPGELWSQDRSTGEKTEIANHADEFSIDISYKFDDSLLEIKREVSGEKKATFIEVPSPPQDYLFLIRLKDWKNLKVVKPKTGSFLLSPSVRSEKIAIIFSFPGVKGKGFMATEYKDKRGRTFILDLPRKGIFDKIWVGVVEDNGNEEPFNFLIKVNNYKKWKESFSLK